MKYKGIELEGLDKKVKLSHSRFMETDEGTDWIDKLLTCDKAALRARRRRWRSSYRRCGIASSSCPSAGRCAIATRTRKVY